MNEEAIPSIKAYQMLFGEYDRTIPFGIAGFPEAGKTISALQESAYIATQVGGNVLYLDTEGGGFRVAKSWWPRFNERFGWEGSYVVRDVRKTKRLLKYLYPHDIDWRESDKGKIDIRLLPNEETKKAKKSGKSALSQFERDIAKENISVVVLDSLTKPLKEDFPGGQLNFPARATAANLILGQLQTMAIEYELYMFVIHHLSKSFDNAWDKGDIVGGINVKHAFKVWLHIEKSTSTSAPHLRYMSLGRYYDQPPRAKKFKTVLTERGFIDHAHTIQEWEKLYGE